MELIISILLGIGLSAAVGFRIFVPFLITGIAAYSGYISLSYGFSWIGTVPAIIMFGVATVIEIAAYYIPWFDNVLDVISAPAAIIAGSILTASTIVGIDPSIKWPIAIIAGGGTAGLIHGLTSSFRLGSTATTGGLGNFAVSSVEAGSSIFLSLISIILPILSFIIVIVFIVFIYRKTKRIKIKLFGKKYVSDNGLNKH